MKKGICRYVSLTAAVLTAGALFCSCSSSKVALTAEEVQETIDSVRFSVQGTGEIAIISDDSGKRYVILPSYADVKSTSVGFDGEALNIKIGDETLVSGQDMPELEYGKEYLFEVCGNAAGVITFVKARDAATLFLTTDGDELGKVNEDPGQEADARVMLYGVNGALECKDTEASIGQCVERAASAGGEAPGGKSYDICLDEAADLFGMGKADTWCLLDVYVAEDAASLAEETVSADRSSGARGLVDVYSNGVYLGLYRLSSGE